MSCTLPCVVFLVAQCILFRIVTACPTGCSCVQDGIVACTQWPSGSAIPPSTKSLALYGFAVDNVPSKAFTDLANLRELTLYSMTIGSISSLSFYGLHNLTSLTIYNSDIGTIESYALYELNNISSLTLYSCVIGNIKPLAFHNIYDVETLSLYGLNVTQMSSHSFSDLHQVTGMVLHSNHIKLIQSCAFRNMNVTTFAIYSSTIGTIEGYGFSEIEVNHFSFYGLNINMFSRHAVYNISNAIRMSLYHNIIGTFSTYAIAGLREIQNLGIYGNDFETYECKALDDISAGVQGSSIYANRLYCDCRNAWLYPMDQSESNPPTICYGPGNFTDRSVSTVTTAELGCNSTVSNCILTSPSAQCLTEEYTTPPWDTTLSPTKDQSVVNQHNLILLTCLYLTSLSFACCKSIV